MSPLPTKMCVACDTVALRCQSETDLEILLVERGNEPFRGCWALPGGFLEENEDLPDGASRELAEETGLRPAVFDPVGAWGTPGRDPRGRVVSIVYLAVAAPGASRVKGMDDAAKAAWHAVKELPQLAFDHAEIVPAALRHLRQRCSTTHMALAFLEKDFLPCNLAHLLSQLGAHMAHTATDRLLAVANVEPAEGGAFRLKTDDYGSSLREPVFLFPPGIQ